MEFGVSHPHGAGAAITVTTKIIQSESPPMKGPKGRKHGPNLQEAEQQEQQAQQEQRESVEAVSRSSTGTVTEALSIRQMEGSHEACASPVIHDRRYHRDLPRPDFQSGFEESPEWRDHYNLSSRPTQTETREPCLPDNHSSLWPEKPLINKKKYSTETFTTARTLSDHSSIDTAELGSRTLLCLRRPPSGRNLFKAGNTCLKHFIKPKNKTYFGTQPIPQEYQDNARPLQRLSLSASKKDVSRKTSKTDMAKIAKDEVASSPKRVRNKESSTSIVDLNQVEARHGVATDVRKTLSETWDEIYRSMGRFPAGSGVDGDNVHESLPVTVDAARSGLRPNPESTARHETHEYRKTAVKLAPLPGPRTSSMYATGHQSPTRQSFDVVVAKLPAQSTSTRWSGSESVNQRPWSTEPDMNPVRTEEKLKPLLREVRSSEGLSKFGAGPDASQSTIALEAIEAEMNMGRPLSPSALADLTQPFSINCTPPQPVTAPTEPPIGPLPELPAKFDAASRMSSSHHPPSKRHSRPAVPPRSRHRRNPSANSASSKATIRPLSSHKGHHHHKNTSVSSRNARKTNSVSSAQGVPARGRSRSVHGRAKMDPSASNNAAMTGFNQYNLGSSQDLRSPVASEAGHEPEMIEPSATPTAEAPLPSTDTLSSRNEHIKGLKLRDLAKEKATRIRGRHQCSDLDDAIVVEAPSLADEDESSRKTPQVSDTPSIPPRPPSVAQDMNGVSSRPASQQEGVSRRPSYRSRRSCSSAQGSQRTVRAIMSPSQIMVLAETDPNTQTFRASTATGSLRRAESKKANSTTAAKERKARRRKSMTGARSQVSATTISNGIPRIKLNGEHTPPHSDPSSHSSDDDAVRRRDQSKSHRSAHHISALAKEDSDAEFPASKRDVAALKRKEESRYFTEQLLLRKMKREIAELKLATRSLSRGLEQLTTHAETDEEIARVRGYSLMDAELEPVKSIAERFERSLSPEDWEGFDRSPPRLQEDDEADADTSSRRAKSPRAKSPRATEARPLSLVSRYNSARNSTGESVIGETSDQG